jgi:hypothetical protein
VSIYPSHNLKKKEKKVKKTWSMCTASRFLGEGGEGWMEQQRSGRREEVLST